MNVDCRLFGGLLGWVCIDLIVLGKLIVLPLMLTPDIEIRPMNKGVPCKNDESPPEINEHQPGVLLYIRGQHYLAHKFVVFLFFFARSRAIQWTWSRWMDAASCLAAERHCGRSAVTLVPRLLDLFRLQKGAISRLA